MSNPGGNCCGQTVRQICGEFADPDVTDMGQCAPAAIVRTCEAPEIPVPECDEEEPVTTFDPDTESFTVLTILYDEDCSPISDSTASNITTLVG